MVLDPVVRSYSAPHRCNGNDGPEITFIQNHQIRTCWSRKHFREIMDVERARLSSGKRQQSLSGLLCCLQEKLNHRVPCAFVFEGPHLIDTCLKELIDNRVRLGVRCQSPREHRTIWLPSVSMIDEGPPSLIRTFRMEDKEQSKTPSAQVSHLHYRGPSVQNRSDPSTKFRLSTKSDTRPKSLPLANMSRLSLVKLTCFSFLRVRQLLL
jgi:hypothetical protein